MASLAMEIRDGDDYLQLPPVEEDGEDYMQLSPVEEYGDGDTQLSPVEEDGDDYLQLPPVEEDGEDYLHLPPVEEDGEDYLHLPPEQLDEEEGDDHGRESSQVYLSFSNALHYELRSYSLADVVPRVGVTTGAPDGGSEVALAVAEALKTVAAPSDDGGRDCPICLQDGGTAAAWKETPCGHRFHGRCVETWLQAKGSCPMCRCKVVEMPAADATSTAAYQDLVRSVIFEAYGQDGVDSAFME